MIMEAAAEGAMAWVTATSGTCVSIFKPVYFGVTMPDTGPMPRETVHRRLAVVEARAAASPGHGELSRRWAAEIRASFEAAGGRIVSPRAAS